MKNFDTSEIWCRFVFNEGIMPSALVRYIKQQSFKDEVFDKVKLTAKILKERENFDNITADNTANADLQNSVNGLARIAFQGDKELCSWLQSIDGLLDVIIGFSNVQTFEDKYTAAMINNAYQSFINSCPLVAADTKKRYLQIAIPQNDDKKEDFINFLMLNDYGKSTCNSYKTSVNKGGKLLGENLWEIDDSFLLAAKIQVLYKKHEDEMLKSNKALACGLDRYKEFLESRQK
ncbi:MAG: hypothetical protein VZR95_04040 [Alphaproteobacteria bacterium]